MGGGAGVRVAAQVRVVLTRWGGGLPSVRPQYAEIVSKDHGNPECAKTSGFTATETGADL